MLLQKEIAHDVIAYAISLIVYNFKKVKDITSGIDSGIGVRLIYDELATGHASRGAKSSLGVSSTNWPIKPEQIPVQKSWMDLVTYRLPETRW